MSVLQRPLPRSTSAVVLCGAVAASVAWLIWDVRSNESAVAALVADRGTGRVSTIDTSSMLIRNQGIDLPTIAAAESVRLDDSAEVIGIQVGDRFRAYRLESLASGPANHIVNDMIDDVPVTVTYCDVADCTRAFSGPQRGQPLTINQGGLYRAKRMLLRVGDSEVRYFQDDGSPFQSLRPDRDFPFASYPFVRSTWKAWRTAHPATDVYMGRTRDTSKTDTSNPG